MNFHSKEWIMNEMSNHLMDALDQYNSFNIVGLFYQGSGNYGMDTEKSDADTKLIITPSLNTLIFNHKPVSTTHVRENNSHLDAKDVRLYMQTFRKQNLNFLEILFTEYKMLNHRYEDAWNDLVKNRELIAHYDESQAVKAMRGVAMEKYHALEHPYPVQIEELEKFGYAAKQLHHLLRVEDYLERYIAGERYEDCLRPSNADFLVDIKLNHRSLDEARKMADKALAHIDEMYEKFTPRPRNEEVEEILDSVQERIVRTSIKFELKE